MLDYFSDHHGGPVADFAASGRLIPHKGGGSGAAIKEQKKARQESARQFAWTQKFQAQQMKLAKGQAEAAANYQVATPPPAPTTDSLTTDTAGLEIARQNKRRFGLSKTTYAGETYRPTLGVRSGLGGMTLAA